MASGMIVDFLRSGVRTYDPALILTVYGVMPLTGFAPDTFLTIQRVGEGFKSVRGTDLSFDRIATGNTAFDITFTLKQTSVSNTILSGLLTADLLGNVGGLPLIMKDLNGITTFLDTNCYIVQDPISEYGRKMGIREWKLRTVNGINILGNNF